MRCTNLAYLKGIECQIKRLVAYARLQRSNIRKYYRKFLVSNISHIELIIYIKKFTTVNILGQISYRNINNSCPISGFN